MADWETTTLGDLVELQRGHDLPSVTRGVGKVPVIGSFGVTGLHDKAKYSGPGVAIGRSGASIGKATYVADDYWPLNTCLFVSDFKGNDARWVFRLLDLTDFESFNSGSAQPSLNRNFLKSIPVSVPPLAEQRAIAEVLGALDDKIAANTHLAATADSLAIAEFRRAVAGVGFSSRTFADVADVGGGGTPSTKVPEYWDGGIPWASPTDITKLFGPYLFETARTITQDGLANCSSPLYPTGSILMTSRATIGAFALAGTPVAVNQGFIVVVPPDAPVRYWLFHEMRDRVEEFLTHANGATFLELSRGNFRRLPVRLPGQAAMDSFGRKAETLHARASAALRQNIALTEARDALLPALMSGKLRVRDAEGVVEALT